MIEMRIVSDQCKKLSKVKAENVDIPRGDPTFMFHLLKFAQIRNFLLQEGIMAYSK